MSLGSKLKVLREKRGWNRAEAARQLALKYTTYVGYENDEREPGHTFLIQAAKRYGVTLDFLLEMTGNDLQLFPEKSDLRDSNVSTLILKEDERIYITSRRKLSDTDREFIDRLLETYRDHKGSDAGEH